MALVPLAACPRGEERSSQDGVLLSLRGASDDGEPFVGELKAWTPARAGGQLRWETRRLLPLIGAVTSEWQHLCRSVRKCHVECELMCHALGYDVNTELGSSRQSIRQSGGSTEQLKASEQEAWLSTPALLLALLGWQAERRKAKQKAAANTLLKLFLEATLGSRCFSEFAPLDVCAGEAAACTQEPVLDGLCLHWQSVQADFGQVAHEHQNPQARLHGALKALYKNYPCPVVAHQFALVLRRVELAIVGGIDTWGDFAWHATPRARLPCFVGYRRQDLK